MQKKKRLEKNVGGFFLSLKPRRGLFPLVMHAEANMKKKPIDFFFSFSSNNCVLFTISAP